MKPNLQSTLSPSSPSSSTSSPILSSPSSANHLTLTCIFFPLAVIFFIEASAMGLRRSVVLECEAGLMMNNFDLMDDEPQLIERM